MFSRFDRRPWVVVEHANTVNGTSSRFKGGLRSRADAEQSVRAMNQFSPYGRTYHTSYWWEARPATAEEVELLTEMSFTQEVPNA